MILLDTNVISETTKPVPDAHVPSFLSEQEPTPYLSDLTLAELYRGAALSQSGQRRDSLDRWISYDPPSRFAGRIVMLGEDEAPIWGELMAQPSRLGLNLEAIDGLIAATAPARRFTLATRNRKHFDGLGLTLTDPSTAWSERSTPPPPRSASA